MAYASFDVMGSGGSFYDPIGSTIEGFLTGGISDYFSRKSEERAYERQKDLMEEQYKYAGLYALNSPSWTVKGLRDAGINPIIAFSKGANVGSTVPSIPSTISHSASPSFSSSAAMVKYDPLVKEDYRTKKLHNDTLEDNLNTLKAENEVKRLKSEAVARVLRPEFRGEYDGEGKAVGIYTDSKGFKALQKAIADDYDLRSEKYVRETIDAVFRYGTDVLKLLPIFRRKELMDTLQKTIKTDPNGRRTTFETYTQHGPK